MQSLSRLPLWAALLGLVVSVSACGGRALSRRLARDVISGSPAAVLTANDIDVISVTQVGAREAIVETYLHSAFRLERTGGAWHIREVRVGRGQWEKMDDVLQALQMVKTDRTRKLLEEVAAATEAYRRKNGGIPAFSDFVGLADALYPGYLTLLIRDDAWNHPLAAYRLSGSAIRLVSAGPDGRMGTADDIELTRAFPAGA
jgi:hypothetical protein